jgi:hypothetical protein
MPKDYKHSTANFQQMKKVALLISVFLLFAGLAIRMPSASAHSEILIGDIKIVAGWATEPPLVNQLNNVVLEITHNSTGKPINNAVGALQAEVKKGAASKPLDFSPTEEDGVYNAQIIPTQPGKFAIALTGTIGDQAIDTPLELEDVEDSRPLQFPPVASDRPTDPLIIEQLQQVIADLNSQVDQAKTASEKAVESANAATQSATELKQSADRAYLFGMVGVGVGVAGIVIGVRALTRGKDS